ncbi:valine--tRNA ligase [Candidatus Woesearchaeota archaeon]|nr:MAG: valine--tRNA ligase [Candidatus Woesearchaeota archaeon]
MSGRMHIGHAFSFSQQDFIARYKRMKGFEVFYPFGTDDNGLPTIKLVQKELKLDVKKMSRAEEIKVCLDYVNEHRAEFIQDWKDLGMSCDFDYTYSTIDEDSRRLSQRTFIDLYNKGLIKRRKGPIMWDRVFQSAIAQAELEDETRKAYLNYVKAKIEGSVNTYVIYATTRPELCFAVVGMSVEDSGEYVKLKVGDEYWITGKATYEEKFKDFEYEIVEELKGQNLIGEKVKIPSVDKVVEISHDVAVKADFGTGIAYFCTYGGAEDIEWVSRHKATPVELIDKAGRLNNLGGDYEGKLAEEARKDIIISMKETGDIIFNEKKEQVVNVSERNQVEVEYIVSYQWYVEYLDKKEYLFEMANKFNWYPTHMKIRLENWIKGLNWDWGFSRQRNYGIPIPVWYDKEGNEYLPDVDQLPIDPVVDRPNSAPKDLELIPETDTMDTWFTSGSSPELPLVYVKNEDMRKKLFPMDLRPQAHDIINFWLFYTMSKNNLLYDANPFKDVAISGFALDPHGKKMSKSKVNVVDPREMHDKYNSDAIRYWAAGSKLGEDMPFQEKDLVTANKTTTKMWNATKFAIMQLDGYKPEGDAPKLEIIDAWLISKLNKVIDTATKSFDKYEYSKAKSEVELFFWQDLCDNYLEIVKDRMYNPDEWGKEKVESGKYSLYTAFSNVIKLFAPFMPYITEEVYQLYFADIEGIDSVHRAQWPISGSINDGAIKAGDLLVEVLAEARKYKSQKGLSLKVDISKAVIKTSLENIEFIKFVIEDLKSASKIQEIVFEEKEGFNVEICD